MKYNKVLIVGAGFFGSVVAERIANKLKIPVTIIDKRNHIGGNCWSEICKKTGIEIHKYGSHIFHTSKKEVWKYVNNFTAFNDYRHFVYTTHKEKIYSMPINLSTINMFYNTNIKPFEVKAFIKNEINKENIINPQNLEEKAISLIGRPLYGAFIKGYTEKQWEKPLTELPADIFTRLPIRYNFNNRYFSDTYEGIPLDGYGKLFKNILKNNLIELKLN